MKKRFMKKVSSVCFAALMGLSVTGCANELKFDQNKLDTLIEDLSSFFIVSRVSVKYRLIEVGLLDKLRDFNDFDAVFAEITESKELVALTPLEAYQLLAEDSSLREWVRGGKFVYVDGYFVLASFFVRGLRIYVTSCIYYGPSFP